MNYPQASFQVAEEEDLSVHEQLQLLKERLADAYDEAAKRSAKSAGVRAKYYNKGKKSKQFDAGDKVYVFEPAVQPGEAKKFRRPWRAGVVVRRTSDVNYEIRMGPRALVIHVNRLKPRYSDSEDSPREERNKVRTPEPVEPVSEDEMEVWVPVDNDRFSDEEETIEPLQSTQPLEIETDVSEEYDDFDIHPISPPEPKDDHRGDPSYRPGRVAGAQPRRSPYPMRQRKPRETF